MSGNWLSTQAATMAGLLSAEVRSPSAQLDTPGSAVHEMGGGCTGNDSHNSVSMPSTAATT
jgi:hypothetical protein